MTGLVKEAEKLVKGNKDSVGLVVYLTDKKEAPEQLKQFAAKHKIETVALTVNKSGSKAPPPLKLDAKVKHTILVYKGKKVVHNFAYNKITKDDVKQFVEKAKPVLKPSKKLL